MVEDNTRLPRVLIGIVSYNRAEILPNALKSGLGQSYPNLSVTVTDDASTDTTRSLCECFVGVEWKFCVAKEGYLKARNDFMSRPGYDYFVSLDDDSWFQKSDEIALAVEYLESHPDVAAIAFDILSPDRPDQRARGEPYPVSMFIGCGHVVRISCAKAVGFYDSLPGFYGGEEKDFCLRMLDLNYQVVLMPGVHVWHDKTNVSRSIPKQHASGVCNDFAFTIRRTPLLWLVPALLSKFISHGVFSFRSGLFGAYLRGLGVFVLNFRSLWRSRKPVRSETLRRYRDLSKLSK